MLLMNFKSYLPLIVLCFPLFSLPVGLRQEAVCPGCCSNFRMGCLSRTLHGIPTRIGPVRILSLSGYRIAIYLPGGVGPDYPLYQHAQARLGYGTLEKPISFLFFSKKYSYHFIVWFFFTSQISFPKLQLVARMKVDFKNQ